jgi:hypothetical protein
MPKDHRTNCFTLLPAIPGLGQILGIKIKKDQRDQSSMIFKVNAQEGHYGGDLTPEVAQGLAPNACDPKHFLPTLPEETPIVSIFVYWPSK